MDLLSDEGNRLTDAHIPKIDGRNVDLPENGLEIWSAPLSNCDGAKVISRRKISRIRRQEGFEKRFCCCVIALAKRVHGLQLNLLLLRREIRKRKEQQGDQPFHEPLYTVAVWTSIAPAT